MMQRISEIGCQQAFAIALAQLGTLAFGSATARRGFLQPVVGKPNGIDKMIAGTVVGCVEVEIQSVHKQVVFFIFQSRNDRITRLGHGTKYLVHHHTSLDIFIILPRQKPNKQLIGKGLIAHTDLYLPSQRAVTVVEAFYLLLPELVIAPDRFHVHFIVVVGVIVKSIEPDSQACFFVRISTVQTGLMGIEGSYAIRDIEVVEVASGNHVDGSAEGIGAQRNRYDTFINFNSFCHIRRKVVERERRTKVIHRDSVEKKLEGLAAEAVQG